MNFRTISNDIKTQTKRTKPTFFHPSLTPLFTFYIWGITHFTPLSTRRGAGGEAISPPTPSANVLSHHDTALSEGSRGLLLPAS